MLPGSLGAGAPRGQERGLGARTDVLLRLWPGVASPTPGHEVMCPRVFRAALVGFWQREDNTGGGARFPSSPRLNCPQKRCSAGARAGLGHSPVPLSLRSQLPERGDVSVGASRGPLAPQGWGLDPADPHPPSCWACGHSPEALGQTTRRLELSDQMREACPGGALRGATTKPGSLGVPGHSAHRCGNEPWERGCAGWSCREPWGEAVRAACEGAQGSDRKEPPPGAKSECHLIRGANPAMRLSRIP